MPLYEYRCDACEHQFERIQKYSDPPVDLCPSCGSGPVVKLLSSPAFQFKGTGWYITDYARKGQGGSAANASTGGGKSDGTSEGSASDGSASRGSGSTDGNKTKTEPASTTPAATAKTPAKD